MQNLDPIIIELIKGLALAFATWAGLKIEIQSAKITAKAAKESADQCHTRLDNHLERGH